MVGRTIALLVAATLFCLGVGSGAAMAAELAEARVAANVRAAPSVESARVSVLEQGQSVRILSESEGGSWVRISDLWGNELGFVAERLLHRPNAPAAASNSGAGGSIFAQAVQSGAIDQSHEEIRRAEEEAERRRLEAWQAELDRMDAEREERDRIARLEQEEFEREQAELREWALQSEDYSGSRGDALDDLATAMAGQLQTMQNDLAQQQAQQRWAEQQQRQRQQQQQWQQQQQQAQTRPSTNSYNSPTYNSPTGNSSVSTSRPSTGGGTSGTSGLPSSSSSTAARSNQCWYTPDPPQASCVAESVNWDDGRFVIKSRNVCNKRIVVRACGYRGGAGEYCGMSGVGSGSTWTHLVGKSMNPTGGYRVEWAGSVNSVEDWTCMSRGG